MKKVMVLFLLSSLLMGCNQGTEKKCLSDNLGEGVVAFYSFSNGSLDDASPNKNDLLNVHNAVSGADREGNESCAYEFDNRDSSFLTTTNTSFLNNLDDFSIVMWYLPLDTGEVTSNQILISRGLEVKCPPKTGEWAISLFEEMVVFGHKNLVWRFFSVWHDDYDAYLAETKGIWHHVAAVNDGDEMLLYLDGVLVGTATGIKPCTSGLPQDKGDLFIGKGLKGRLDDIVIYNRAISFDEVQKLKGLDACCE